MRARRVGLWFSVAAVLVLVVPAVASASSVSKSGGVLTLSDPQGDDNDLQLDATGGNFVFTENGAVSPIAENESSCTGNGTATVSCSSTGVTAIAINLGDGVDSVLVGDNVGVPVTVNGGVGADTLSGGNGGETINGNEGADT